MQDLPTFVASNSVTDQEKLDELWKSHKEVWGYYPDDEPRHSIMDGDSRGALSPLFAFRWNSRLLFHLKL